MNKVDINEVTRMELIDILTNTYGQDLLDCDKIARALDILKGEETLDG